jgi:hypothetical protein
MQVPFWPQSSPWQQPASQASPGIAQESQVPLVQDFEQQSLLSEQALPPFAQEQPLMSQEKPGRQSSSPRQMHCRRTESQRKPPHS